MIYDGALGVFHTGVRFFWSKSVNELQHFSFGPVWFHTGKISSEPRGINKSHVGAVISFNLQKSHLSNPLPFSHSPNISDADGLYGCLLRNQEGNSIFCCLSRSTYYYTTKLLVVYLQNHPQPIMHSTDDCRSWFSQIMRNSSAVGVDRD